MRAPAHKNMYVKKSIKKTRQKDQPTLELLALLANAPDCTLANAHAFLQSHYGSAALCSVRKERQTHLGELLQIEDPTAKCRFFRLIYKLRTQGIIERNNGARTITLTPNGVILARQYVRRKKKEMRKPILA